jgi:hypothetical protein
MRKEASLEARALPSRTRDLSLFSQQVKEERTRPLLLSAPESALGSLPSVALSSAQVTAILNPTAGVGSEVTPKN